MHATDNGGRLGGLLRRGLPVLGAAGIAASVLAAASSKNSAPAAASRDKDYSTCESCKNCHPRSYDQHLGSMHSLSFSNPVFQAQYALDVLPLAGADGDLAHAARSCAACHAPIAHQASRAHLVTLKDVDATSSRVACDFCHTITGYTGPAPGNGNYRTEPGPSKYGPLLTKTDWHHRYSALQTRSEFCGICHDASSELGLGVKSTYSEWKASRYAADGIQCQDCHMSVNGFLTQGRPVHEWGQAASMTLGSSPERTRLYTHRFEGARSQAQVEGAIRLAFTVPSDPVWADGALDVGLSVDNSRTGHKMPSGSVELRSLWLEVYAVAGGARIELRPATQAATHGYDVAGANAEVDQALLGGGIPPGNRIYRTILADRRGSPTLAFYVAKSILFDNRLQASEVRKETYRLQLAAAPRQPVTLVATLHYRPYPDALAARLGLPKAASVAVASTTAELRFKPR
jgi:hypothetical protein